MTKDPFAAKSQNSSKEGIGVSKASSLVLDALMERKRIAELYAQEFSKKDVKEQIVQVAEGRPVGMKLGNIVIPAPILETMIKCSGSDISTSDACRLYLDAYLKKAGLE